MHVCETCKCTYIYICIYIVTKYILYYYIYIILLYIILLYIYIIVTKERKPFTEIRNNNPRNNDTRKEL